MLVHVFHKTRRLNLQPAKFKIYIYIYMFPEKITVTCHLGTHFLGTHAGMVRTCELKNDVFKVQFLFCFEIK